MSQDPHRTTNASRYGRDTRSSTRFGGYRRPYAETASSTSSGSRTYRGENRQDVAMMDADMPQSCPAPAGGATSGRREYPHAPPPAVHRYPANSIGTNSYMDDDEEDAADLPSPSMYSSVSQRRPAPQSTQPFQSAPSRRQEAVPEDYYRTHQDPRRLLPTAVRPPISFAYDLKPDTAHDHDSSSRHQARNLQFRPVSGSARQLTHSELNRVYSHPFEWQDGYEPEIPPPPSEVDPELNWQSRDAYGHPFTYDPDRAYTASTKSITANDEGPHPRSSRRNEGYTYPGAEKTTSRDAYENGASPLQRPTTRSSARADSSRYRILSSNSNSEVEVRTAGGMIVRVYDEELGADGVWRRV